MRWKSLALLVCILGSLALAALWRSAHEVEDPASAPSGLPPGPPILAPGGGGGQGGGEPVLPGRVTRLAPTPASVVRLRDVPARVYDPDNQLDNGRRQRGRIETPISEEALAARREAALRLAPSARVQTGESAAVLAPTASGGWDSLDYLDCCGGGGNVPPDPELAVGPNHAIAVVNVAFEIYDKSTGSVLAGPITFSSFFASTPNCTGVFDPNVLYDESADRYLLGIDADGSHYCLAASQTGDPTGAWNTYSFQTATGTEFFDYPHAGVGRDAIYMGANIFGIFSFLESRVYAFDKAAIYAGTAAASVSRGLGSAHDTPQPLHLHGFAQGTWPSSGPHYVFVETDYDGANHTVFAWNDPFGANTWTTVGGVNLNSATGVTAGMPVDVPQSGGSNIQGNDWRPQDFEYRNGYAWTTGAIACNPGSGTVNCVRWAQIDPTSATVIDAGVYASNGEYRVFPDLAVDACDGMAVGYTKSSSSMFPSIWYTGRESGDPAGTLQAEAQLKAGEITYTAFDSVPRRWGDYTEMTIDPDGHTFWYLGEYSKNTGTTSGRWGTYIGSFSFGTTCGGPVDNPPGVSITNPANGATVSGTVAVTATASDDNDVTQVEFFVDGSSIGVDTNGADGWSASWNTTTTSDGAHSVSATATDTIGQTGSDTIGVTVQNAAPQIAHVGDLDGASAAGSKGKWDATVTVAVHDQAHAPISDATVNGAWSNGASGASSCVTNTNGLCSVTFSVKNREASVTFSVTGVTATGFVYAAGANHDPDGDSNGTVIVVSKDGGGDPGGGAPVHVGDLDGQGVAGSRSKWTAEVTVLVHTAGHAPVAGVTVSGSWGGDTNGGGSCTTSASGSCVVSKGNLRSNQNTVTFTVGSLSDSAGAYSYDAAANHDPDGDSNGTTISVNQP